MKNILYSVFFFSMFAGCNSEKNPTPVIESITPVSVPVGTKAFDMIIKGENFEPEFVIVPAKGWSKPVRVSDTKDENKAKPSFIVIEMAYLKKFDAMRITWQYNIPDFMDISVYVGDSLDQQMIFFGEIEGAGYIDQVTNLHASNKEYFFVSIEDQRTGKILCRQKLVNDAIFVDGKIENYVLYSKNK